MAEGVGLEPTWAVTPAGFQDRCLAISANPPAGSIRLRVLRFQAAVLLPR